MKYYIYSNGNAENHGCEAITRSTCKIINGDTNTTTLASFNSKNDIKYGLDKICNIVDVGKNIDLSFFRKALYKVSRKINGNNDMQSAYQFKYILENARNAKIALSAGGDNYCYKNSLETLTYVANKIINEVDYSVLWGCSVEPDVIRTQLGKQTLKTYDLIVARESITYNTLLENGINKNVKLYPDPAFTLDSVELDLPEGFIEGNTIGINVSPLIIGCESNDGVTMKNHIALIQYIIETTDMQVALIPHVVAKGNDDRTVLKELYDKFKDTGRVVMIKDCNCMELKGYIARCRMFIGARTHATIAAYSKCVPTLVVGYSVKAKGIAKDIFGTYDNYVIPVQTLKNETDLINAFKWIKNNENEIRKHLQEFMPEYKKNAYKAADEIRKLIK